ncbi:MAG: 50S ribosomal protein L13 [Bacteroidales bacterium]|nr:50S ribosomal protein L13 [Bacteroidales bacterium]
MDTLSYRTISAKKETVVKEWVLLNAEGQVLGRLASHAAKMLRGKNKPYYTPHVDCGDHVVIINAEKIVLTGNKMTGKEYVTHSGYPGGKKIHSPAELLKKRPTAVVEEAIRGMLPRTRLGREIYRNLHVYAGPEHPHQGQSPKEIDINTIK